MKRPFQRVDIRNGKMVVNYCGERILVDATLQWQFLQNIDWWDRTNDSFCIHLSDYNHRKVNKLKRISPVRWVTGHNLKLYPGFGSGKLTIGDFTFDVTYAWGGRSKPPAGWTDRSSYTVKVKGIDIRKRIQILVDQINQHEGAPSGGFSIKNIETDFL